MSDKFGFIDLERLIKSDLWRKDDGLRKWIWMKYFELIDSGTPPPDGFTFDDPIGAEEYFGDWDGTDEAQQGGREAVADTHRSAPIAAYRLPTAIDREIAQKQSLVDHPDSEEDVDAAPEVEKEIDTTPEVAGTSEPTAEEEEEEEEEEDAPTRDMSYFYDFSPPQRTFIQKFNVSGISFYVRFKHLNEMKDMGDVLLALFSHILESTFVGGGVNDEVGLEIRHPSLDTPILIPFTKRENMSASKVVEVWGKVLNSRKEMDIDRDISIKVTRIDRTRGGRLREQYKGVWQRWFESKCGGGSRATFIRIENTGDDLCFARATVVARARILKDRDPEVADQWEAIRKGDRKRHTLQKRMAQELMEEAGLGDHRGPCGHEEFTKLQEVLDPEFQLKIFALDYCNGIIFEGRVEDPETADKLYLYLHHGHFSVIARITGFVNYAYWCDRCNKGYSHSDRHRCAKKCWRCKKVNTDCGEGYNIYCEECNCWFSSQTCFDNHKSVAAPAGGKGRDKCLRLATSTCQRFRRCKKCGKKLNTDQHQKNRFGNSHVCGYVFCPKCRTFSEEGEEHRCFIQKVVEKKKKKSGDERQAEREEREGNDPDDLDAIVRRREIQQDRESTRRNRRRAAEEDGNVSDDDVEAEWEDRDEVDGRIAPEDEGLDVDVEEEEVEDWCYIFWDFETTQDREIDQIKYGPMYAHDVNCCIALKICNVCKDLVIDRESNRCVKCGQNERIFLGEDCKDQFCQWLFGGENEGVIAMAHNARGFDGQFLLQYLIKQGIKPTIVAKGREITMMHVKQCKVRVLDSLNFLPMALSALPKSFGEKEIKKGFFPHLFNKPENWNYVGPMPDAYYYGPANMSAKKRDEFYRWYSEQSGKTFDFQKEILEYCKSDVDILMRCSLKFEDTFHSSTGVRPFQKACTIAAACNYVFRKRFMKENSIGVVPHGGYRRKERQSNTAIRWLEWVSREESIRIQHAKNHGEKTAAASNGKQYKLDGYAVVDGKERAYEFQGCCWHGCKKCYWKRDDKVPGSTKSMDDAYAETLEKVNCLRRDGYEVVEMWECELRKQLVRDKEMKEFFDSVEIVEPLDPKDAFFGGRTNATKLLHICGPGEKIRDLDVVSLYPWANKWGKYPGAHPRIILDDFQPVTKDSKPYFGIIKCKVLPPRQLYHPVLPVRSHGKLVMALCRTCMEEQARGYCTHSDEERAIIGTWVTLEVDKAVDCGYEVKKIYEVYHYDKIDQHDGVDPKTGLFTEYINFFMRGKVEASGWPADVQTEEQKAAFIAEYKEREGMTIDPDNMVKNDGRRTLAKLMLNSFWGKFGQRANMAQGEFFVDGVEFLNRFSNPTNELQYIVEFPDNEEMIYASYKKHEDHVEIMSNTSTVIAAFTTCIARLKLYSYLEKLGERVLYFDTDSIIYLSRDGVEEYEPKIGQYLGEMSDELRDFGAGAYIDRFVSGGPKNYAFRVKKPDGSTIDKVKCRGFTQTYQTSAHLNRKSLERKVKKFVKEGVEETTTLVRPHIRRRADRQVVTVCEGKDHRVVYNKRIVLSDYCTIPYGTCEN